MFSTLPMTFLGHDNGDTGGGSTSYVDSVQQIEITIGGGDTSETATITSVNTSRSVIFWGGTNTDNTGNTQREIQARIALTNATTVTAYRDTSDATYGVTLRATVVEFTSDMVDSVQSGTITISSGESNTATISSVTTSRSVVLWQGFTGSGATSSMDNLHPTLALTNSTTVTATRGESTSAYQPTIGYTVVQFKSAVIDSIQTVSRELSGLDDTDAHTITSVDTNRSVVIYNGARSTLSTFSAWMYRSALTAATTVTSTRESSSSSSRTVAYTVVEFASGVVNKLRRGSTAVTSTNATADTTITSVDTSKSVLIFGGYGTDSTGADDAYTTATLLNSTTVRAERTSTSSDNEISWEVVEFN